MASINCFINSYCDGSVFIILCLYTAAANYPAEHLVCCVLCMFPQFSKDKCKPVTEICRTPPNARYLGIEMFNSVYNHPPTPPFKYHNMTLGHINLSKKEGFSSKKCSDRSQVHPFTVSMCQNYVISDDCCGTPFFAETALVRHCSASNF